MDNDPPHTQDLSFDTALSNAARLAQLAEDADNDPGRRQATAQLAIAWGTIAQAPASKYATPPPISSSATRPSPTGAVRS
jgi:hypothetical protein